MLSTLAGMLTEVKLVAPLNAFWPMLVTLAGMLNVVSVSVGG